MKKELIFLVGVVLIVAAYAALDATKDTLAHHYSVSIFSESNAHFWDANLSWCNKWSNCESGKERFWGSSSFFVFMTDGWHLMKFFIDRLIWVFPAFLMMIMVDFEHPFLNKDWVKFCLFWVLLSVWQNLVFTLFYHHLLLR
jgi:hypothetical protein